MWIGNDDHTGNTADAAASRIITILHIPEGIHGVGGIVGGIFQVARVAQHFLLIGKEFRGAIQLTYWVNIIGVSS